MSKILYILGIFYLMFLSMSGVSQTPNTTIADFKTSYSGGLDSISDNIIIQGVVVANDASGNIYKKIIIQDNTGGIEILVNNTMLYDAYSLGQHIIFKCQGLFLGNYGGIIQLGINNSGSIGKIPFLDLTNYIISDSLVAIPAPMVLTIPVLSVNHISTLVKLDSVYFPEAGQLYSSTYAPTNRTIKDANGDSIFLRTSNYAFFSSNTLPFGNVSLTGILGVFNGQWQFYIRDLNDVVGTQTPIANFSATPTNVDVGDTVVFTDLSTNTPSDWLWKFGDGVSSTDQNPSHVYTEIGNFTVTLSATNTYGCNIALKNSYIVVGSYGITNISSFSPISIYPNPTSDNITIELSQTPKESALSICNIKGQELVCQPIKDIITSIDISNLSCGVYFVKLITEKAVEVRKIIKE